MDVSYTDQPGIRMRRPDERPWAHLTLAHPAESASTRYQGVRRHACRPRHHHKKTGGSPVNHSSHAARLLCLGAALALSACASVPQPSVDALRNAGNTLAQAEDARAADYAPEEMRAAREKLRAATELARQARNDNSNATAVRARWLADEALADAKLAEARAQSVRMTGLLRQRQRELAPPPPPEPMPTPDPGSQP